MGVGVGANGSPVVTIVNSSNGTGNSGNLQTSQNSFHSSNSSFHSSNSSFYGVPGGASNTSPPTSPMLSRYPTVNSNPRLLHKTPSILDIETPAPPPLSAKDSIKHGRVINDITVGKVLGRGHSGNVYMGTWMGNTAVALKKLKAEEVNDFAQEVAILMYVWSCGVAC